MHGTMQDTTVAIVSNDSGNGIACFFVICIAIVAIIGSILYAKDIIWSRVARQRMSGK